MLRRSAKSLILFFLIMLVWSCAPENKNPASLQSLVSGQPSLTGKKDYLASPFVTAGDRVYMVGNQDGSAEAVIEDNGWVVDPDDLENQSKLIMDLIKEPEMLKTFSENALRVSDKYFSYSEFKMKHQYFFNHIFSSAS